MTSHLTYLDKPQLAVYAETNMRRMILQIDETNEKRVEYKLQPMNKKERQFVHELSDLYNIYSTGRDIEPNRYLVLIAEKGIATIVKENFTSFITEARDPRTTWSVHRSVGDSAVLEFHFFLVWRSACPPHRIT